MDWGIIGHEWAVNLLAEHVALSRERHAYLFTGPSGIGRRTLALRFAQSLNCERPPVPGQPCLICSSCKRIEQMQHPDLILVQAEREGETLRIDQVRELQHTLSLSPYEARYRIALILRIEEANSSAANAMLKTLEEPPEHVIVILTANSPEILLPTITSRCEVLRLRSLSIKETANGLQIIRGVPEEDAERLAHISDGRPGYAIRLFEQPTLLSQRQRWLDELVRQIPNSHRERFASAKEIADDKEGLKNKLQLWLTFWRDVMVCVSGGSNSVTNLDYSEQIQKLAAVTDLDQAKFYVNSVVRTIDCIDHNVNARLALEVMLIDLPKMNITS
jgi:DNA polymerase-3 subunit delta'